MNKKVLLIGGLHGDEVSSYLFLNKLKEKSLNYKDVEFIPFVNRKGFLNNEKLWNGMDLNRSFNSDKAEVLNHIRKKIDSADIIIDIHSNTRGRTEPYVVILKQNLFVDETLGLASTLGFKFYELADLTVNPKRIEGTLMNYVSKESKIVITVELPAIQVFNSVMFNKLIKSFKQGLKLLQVEPNDQMHETMKIKSPSDILITNVFIREGSNISKGKKMLSYINLLTNKKGYIKSRSSCIVVTIPEKGVYLSGYCLCRVTIQ
jgi:predicted deacylase